MRKILIISAVFPPEPVVSALLSRDIAVRLSKNHKVFVLCPNPSRPEGYQFPNLKEPTNYKVIRLNSFLSPDSKIIGRLRESYSLGKHCAEYIAKNAKDIDCIYINSWPLASQYLIIKAARKSGIPSVLHIQDIYPESLIGKLPKIARNVFYNMLLPVDHYILRNATKVLCISENMISYLSRTRKVERSKFELIRNWQDDQSFLNFTPGMHDDLIFTFMYVGSISSSAGVALLIHAFHKANLKECRLLIIGNGAEKQDCVELARKFDNQHIEFLEVIPEEVPAMQSKADVLLLPLKKGISLTATPSKLTAYLFSAKPVIACVEPESDVANILKDCHCGVVTDPENVDALALVMKKVRKKENAELEEMGQKGKRYAILNLSKEANLSRVITIIEDTILWK